MNYTSHTYDTCMNSIASELAVQGLHHIAFIFGLDFGLQLQFATI